MRLLRSNRFAPRSAKPVIVAACREAFKRLAFPHVQLLDVEVREIESERFGLIGDQRCYIVTLKTSNAAAVRGDVLPFKGSYKERIEALVQEAVDVVEPGTLVHIEIAGHLHRSLDTFVSLKQLLETGKAVEGSPLLTTARRYRIPRALMHGRHLIGPSPALAELVGKVVRERQIKSVLELFGGTGIASKVACMEGQPTVVTVVESDKRKVPFLRKHLPPAVNICNVDAFEYSFDGAVDLIVADPFYDQTLRLLDVHGEAIRRFATIFLLACASVEDVGWISMVRQKLVRLGFRPKKHSLFGQVIFECQQSAERR